MIPVRRVSTRYVSSLPELLPDSRPAVSFPLPSSSWTPLLRGRCYRHGYRRRCTQTTVLGPFCYLRGGVRHNSSSITTAGDAVLRSMSLEDFFGERVTFFLQFPPTTTGSDDNVTPATTTTTATTTGARKADLQRINDAIQALDAFQLSVITRGKSNFSEGGDSDGDSIQASHASAVVWADLLLQAFAFHNSSTHSGSSTSFFLACPMLTVVAVAPLLCQTGVQYVNYLDKCLQATIPSSTGSTTKCSILRMVQQTLQQQQQLLQCHKDSNNPIISSSSSLEVSPREKLHLEALYFLMQDRHREALSVYLKVLTLHPGDILALTLAIDIAYVIGEPKLALRAATSVSQYIQERRQRGPSSFSTYFISGYNVALSWVSWGLALGGHYREADTMAHSTLGADPSSSGGISTAALCTVYDTEGRITEGCSLLMAYDGIQHYKDCGWLAFDCKLAAYGARFILDRDGGDHGGDVALRVYDDYFNHRLVNHRTRKQRPSPQKTPSLVSRALQAGKAGGKSVIQSMFGIGVRIDNEHHHHHHDDHNKNHSNIPFHVISEHHNATSERKKSQQLTSFNRSSLENLLTFLPPTPQLLVHATLLLLRITLAGVIATDDERWIQLREAWKNTLSELQDSRTNNTMTPQPLHFFPLADALSALLVTDTTTTTSTDEKNDASNTLKFSSNTKQGLYEMGKLMALGISSVSSSSSSSSSSESVSPWDDTKMQQDWSRIVSLLASSSEGRGWAVSDAAISSVEGASNYQHHLVAFEQDLRPILCHALCHAALLSKSYESLSLARAICSEDVTLRPNCADSWWRYSLILDELGDTVAAENARMAFTTFGSGVRSFKSGWNFLQ